MSPSLDRTCDPGLKVENRVSASLEDIVPLAQLCKVLLLQHLDVILALCDDLEALALGSLGLCRFLGPLVAPAG